MAASLARASERHGSAVPGRSAQCALTRLTSNSGLLPRVLRAPTSRPHAVRFCTARRSLPLWRPTRKGLVNPCRSSCVPSRVPLLARRFEHTPQPNEVHRAGLAHVPAPKAAHLLNAAKQRHQVMGNALAEMPHTGRGTSKDWRREWEPIYLSPALAQRPHIGGVRCGAILGEVGGGINRDPRRGAKHWARTGAF